MTLKRFTLLEDTNGGLDTVLETMVKDNGKFLTHKECCDLLNELYEKNEQLKHRLAISEKANFVTALEKENERLKACVEEVVDFFSEENEQLKKRNKKRLQRLKNQRKELEKQQRAIWGYKGDIKQLKAQLKDCEKRVTDKEVEWLRNNTVWEQMPSNKRTYISTIYHKRNDE